VKKRLLQNYKAIIDEIISNNKNLSRLILVSQYYPAVTMFTLYLIYSGFSHVASAEGKRFNAFDEIHYTMQELYNDIRQYVALNDKEIIFIDMASSLNPLAGYHTLQIEPNEKGAKVMGKLIAEAVSYEFNESVGPKADDKKIIMYLSLNENNLETQPLNEFYVPRRLDDFVRVSRYRHLRPSTNTSFAKRMQNTYHFFAGDRFDAQYDGKFALGLLDLTVAPIIASYLWQHALDTTNHLITRFPAAAISTPILIARFFIGMVCALALMPLIGTIHLLMKLIPERQPVTVNKIGENKRAERGSTESTDHLLEQPFAI